MVLLREFYSKAGLSGKMQKLLLHCCCAPCASYVLEYLSEQFETTAFFFNPNIIPKDEHDKRAEELCKLMELAKYPNSSGVTICGYEPDVFSSVAESYSDEPEGGRRCGECFRLRLSKTAAEANAGGYDFFATTLTVSPHKNVGLINEIGNGIAEQCSAAYLISDFKKKGGFQRSIELSKQYGLYRQSYCGCFPSVRDAAARRRNSS